MKNLRARILVAATLSAVLAPAGAHDVEEGSGRLGKVAFPTSCDPKVQAQFERGVAMLHSFWYSAAERTFRDVLVHDPQCAIAGWGIAAILMSNPLAGSGALPKDAEKAQAAIDQARQIGAKTARERDYIEAVAAYYADFANRPERARQESRAKAFEALAARYPDDDEAQIFSALYIAGTQSQGDQTYAAYQKAAAVLEKQFVKYPDHPGVAHYLIHSYDAPPIANQGLTAARRYAAIAPDAPHALHMPSHIFTRVGAWADSTATNHRSAEVAVKGGEPDEGYHATDYAVYAQLQLGRDADALRDLQQTLQVTGTNPSRPAAPYARAAMPARYALERGAWDEAAQLKLEPTTLPYVAAITHFARALGALRSNGDPAAARADAAQLAVLHKALVDGGNRYWATEVEVQRLTIAGWTALVEKKPDDALTLMRAAADLEDHSEKHIVTPGRMLPARELLGDMLMEVGQPAAALKEYEASQVREPNRLRGTYGAARAAEAAGDRAKAAQLYAKVVELTKDAQAARPEIAKARTFVASR